MTTKDLSKVMSPKTSSKLAKKGGKGYLTVVNSKKNGKRLEVLESLYQVLNIQDEIKIGFYEQSILIAPVTAELSLPIYYLKDVGKKKVLYSAGLVAEIADVLGLDFSERVSITLSNVEVEDAFGTEVAFVSAEGGMSNGR